MAAPEEATEYSGRHMLCDSDWPLGGDSVHMSAGRQMSTVYQMARPGLVKTKKAGSKSWGRYQACEDLGGAAVPGHVCDRTLWHLEGSQPMRPSGMHDLPRAVRAWSW